MKITISGTPGSGKSTVAKQVAQELELNHFSSGQFMRDMAKEKKITLLELSAEAEINKEIDEKIDEWVESIGEANDNFVMDSRIAFNFIPDSLKIFLDVSEDEAARRIFHDLRPTEKENTSQGETYENLVKRKESENKRYTQYYDIDYTNPDNYDLVIDTTNMTIHQVVHNIIKFVKERNP